MMELKPLRSALTLCAPVKKIVWRQYAVAFFAGTGGAREGRFQPLLLNPGRSRSSPLKGPPFLLSPALTTRPPPDANTPLILGAFSAATHPGRRGKGAPSGAPFFFLFADPHKKRCRFHFGMRQIGVFRLIFTFQAAKDHTCRSDKIAKYSFRYDGYL